MNWIEEAIQTPRPTGKFLYPLMPKPVHLDRDAKGRVVFRVAYVSGGRIPAYVRVYVRRVADSRWSGNYWAAVQGYEVGNPRERTQEIRAALVRMYTELFEDRCEQTGIPCVNERRKEMKKWLSTTSSQTE